MKNIYPNTSLTKTVYRLAKNAIENPMEDWFRIGPMVARYTFDPITYEPGFEIFDNRIKDREFWASSVYEVIKAFKKGLSTGRN